MKHTKLPWQFNLQIGLPDAIFPDPKPGDDSISGTSLICEMNNTRKTSSANAELIVMSVNAYYQDQDTIKVMREALTSMLYIFDRGLETGMIGRGVCDEARAALGDQDE